jgi:hypothetical protein
MGKRSDFERKDRDFYPTPVAAVVPLRPHLLPGTQFDEPCCGDGTLIRHLEYMGHECVHCSDIVPATLWDRDMVATDAVDLTACQGGVFITNPPWDRKILHPIIEHLSELAPTWLLFDADWMHTQQASQHLPRCEKIVSVGRVCWFPETNQTGKDNCCWYLFDFNHRGATQFYGRTA